MPLSSHEIAAIAQQQQAMFGNMQNYAMQITPVQGGVPGMGQNPLGGYNQRISPYMPPNFVPGLGGGYYSGPAPMPPPRMAMPGWSPAPYGGFAQMAMGLPMSRPGSGLPQVMGEQMAGSAMGGLSVIASGAASVGNTLAAGAGMITMGAGAIGAIGGLASGAGMMAGFGAGTAALGAIPVLGPAAMALGGPIAGGVILGLEAMKFTTQQVYAGVQERQMMNRVLRSNFGGVRGIGQGTGGMGFSTAEMGEMSSMVRSMAGSDIMSSFEDLTRVLDRTSQMGMYRGVRSAEQFRQRFRETVSSLKEIAQTMHTSMEDATRYMEGSRQMGFFTGQQINQNLMKTRIMAGTTGMSFDQMQQIGMQGAQMGRAMGMRGRVGAGAMQEMATNLATGIRTGAFSDEMIAEATGGLTGAEGAQAAAGRLMEINQRWLRQGPGRVMLAALWDPNTGRINESRLQQAMAGGMSFQDLRSMGRANIAETGGRRSEFFRDEERLRGDLMEAGGAPLMLGMIQQHFGKRRDLDLEDPIMQRWLRRRFDMSQGEVELFVKQAREMPRIMEERRVSMRQQLEQEATTRGREGAGIQGLERKYKNMWEQYVENPLRQIGDELTTTMTQAVDRIVGDLEGTVKTTVSERTKRAYVEMARAGGRSKLLATNRAQLAQYEATLNISGGVNQYENNLAATIGRALGTRGPDLETRINNISGYLSQGQKDLISRSTIEQKSQFYNDWVSTIAGGGTGLGYTSEQMAVASTAAKKALMRTVGTGQGMVEFRKKAQAAREGDGGAASWMYGAMTQSLMQSGDPTLKAMFTKAKTPQEKMALLQGLTEGYGESEFNVSGLWTGAGDISVLGGSIEAYNARDRELTSQLGKLVNIEGQGSLTRGWETMSMTEKAAFGLTQAASGFAVAIPGVGATIPGLGGLVGRDMLGRATARATGKGGAEEIMKSEKLRGLLQTASGTGPEAEDAKAQLRDIASGTAKQAKEVYGLTSVGLETLGRLTEKINAGDRDTISTLQNLQKNQMSREQKAVFDQEQRLGRELSQNLTESQDIQRAAGKAGPGAMESLRKISSAMERGDIGEAMRLESEFYTKYGGTEGGAELAGALASKGGAGTYIGMGMTRYQEVMEQAKGSGGARRMTERTLGSVGLDWSSFGGEAWEKLGKRDAVRKQKLQAMIEKGMSADQLLGFVGAEARGGVGAEARKELETRLGILSGGLQKGEAEILAGREAAEASTGGRLRGAGGERNNLTDLATKQANYLKALVDIGNQQLAAAHLQTIALDEMGNAIKENPPNANAAGGAKGGVVVPPAGTGP